MRSKHIKGAKVAPFMLIQERYAVLNYYEDLVS